MSRIGSAGFSALHSFNTSSTFSSVQLSLDAASYGFSQEALHGSSLAAMMAGGLAYRLGKVATFSSFSALNLAASFRWIPRLLAPVLGLSAEVTAFEGCQRLLSALNGEIRNQPNLLSWSGEGGFAEGWRKSFLEFGVLKSVGHLLRSENFILQHLSQDIAMVSSHYVGAWVGWSPHPEGSILDQLLHAEITNIQLSVGMHLSGRLLGGSVSVLERNVDWRALTHFSAGKNEVGNSGLSELSWMNANPPDRWSAPRNISDKVVSPPPIQLDGEYEPLSRNPDLIKIEKILRNICALQFEGRAEEMRIYLIDRQRYRSINGEVFDGTTLLRDYSIARYYRDHPEEVGFKRERSKAFLTGYNEFRSFEYFIHEVLKIPRAHGSDFKLESLKDFDPESPQPYSLTRMQEIFRELLEKQFEGNIENLNYEGIRRYVYTNPEGLLRVSGGTLLLHYNWARWGHDHPGQIPFTLKKTSQQKGYTLNSAITHFAKEVRGNDGKKADLVLNMPIPETLTLEDCERILRRIFELQFASDPSQMSKQAVFNSRYRGENEGKVFSGHSLLNRYAETRWLRDNQYRKRPKRTDMRYITSLKGYSHAECIEYFKRAVLGHIDFANATPEQIAGFIRQHSLGEILDIFSNDAALLTQALAFLKGKEFQDINIAHFVRAYIGLKVEGQREGNNSGGGGADSEGRRERYLKAILAALEAGQALDLSEENFRNQFALFLRLSRREFSDNPRGFLLQLAREAEAYSHPFLQRLYLEAIAYYERVLAFEVRGLKTVPYPYQQEGACFLATHERAILGDEAGMGKSLQTIAAVESLGLKRVLWVTTASNKTTLQEEILGHSFATEHDVKVVISGDPRERKQQIRALNGERYIITNYETLVALERSDSEAYVLLTRDLDAMIVDEAQLTDNPDAFRTRAIQKINSPRTWLLTATPYQNKPAQLFTLLHWLDPHAFSDRAAFDAIYARSTQGLVLLHGELSRFMLRRTKRDALAFFDPPSEKPFADQLMAGVPRLPRRVRIPPEHCGNYELSLEQAEMIAWMIADFESWVSFYNENLPAGASPLNPERINALVKFEMIHRVIFEPHMVGVKGVNPLFAELDAIVDRKIQDGEKLILWAWNTSMVEALERRYRHYGVRRIDGSVVGNPREDARHDFQEEQGVRILVANYQSGGVGLTLTAAHSAIYVQLPLYFPLLYQASGRNQRLIGPEQVHHAKECVEEIWMLARYPEGFVDSIEDVQLATKLSHGTLVEQTRERLEGGELLYNLIMEGFGDPNDLDYEFKAGMIRSMGLDASQPLDYVSHLRGRARVYAELAQHLLPLWNLVKGREEAQRESTLRLMEHFRFYPHLAREVGEVFARHQRFYPEDIEFIISLFQVRNKYIREQLLRHLPPLIDKLYSLDRSLTVATRDLKMDRLSPVAYLGQVYLQNGVASPAILNLARELSGQRDTPLYRYLEEHFLTGIFGIMSLAPASTLLNATRHLFHTASLADKVHTIYRLGLLARSSPDLIDDLCVASFDSWASFASALDESVQTAIARFAGGNPEQVRLRISESAFWRGNADPILALRAAYREGLPPRESLRLQDQFREALSHWLRGDYREWRNVQTRREKGQAIEYRAEDPSFWQEFNLAEVSQLEEIRISARRVNDSIFQDYQNILRELETQQEQVEGLGVFAELQRYRALGSIRAREECRRLCETEVRLFGSLLNGGEVSDPARELLNKYDLALPHDFNSRAQLQGKLGELRHFLSWMRIHEGLDALQAKRECDLPALLREIDKKAHLYRSAHREAIADVMQVLVNNLRRISNQDLVLKNVTIEDSDDVALFVRMGALHPEMINCFNPNGNPTFNQYVVAPLGSRNMRLVVVREGSEVLALAMMKVKRLADGSPVLFLERGLFRKGYDFRREMFQHLLAKSARMQSHPQVMDELRTKPKEHDPMVYGTGAFTENEYVEPVFGLRRARKVEHRGRVVSSQTVTQLSFEGDFNQGKEMSISAVGIGTSNKSLDVFLKELREAGVTRVIDVRGTPQSRFYPHFNQRALREALQKESIDYDWLGDTLGNPKDASGERSLAGFRRHMQTEAYARGLSRLQELMAQTSGKVAVMCSEGKEQDCHRKMILEDLRRRIKKS